MKGWADQRRAAATTTCSILESIADGICDVGLTNHYYLARKIEEDPDFPVELLWANQDDRGAHVNISGGGVTTLRRSTPTWPRQFLEWLATDGQNALVDGNHEFPVNPAVAAEPLITEQFGPTSSGTPSTRPPSGR